MPPRFWERVLLSLGFMEEESYHKAEPNTSEVAATHPYSRGKKKTLVSLHRTDKVRVIVIKPADFASVEDIATHLKERNPVVVNLEALDLGESKRIIDFLSGTIFALDGRLRKIGARVFIFTPPNIDLGGDLPEELAGQRMLLRQAKEER